MHFAANYARHVAPAALFAAEQIEKGQDSGGLEVCPRCISPWRRWRRIRNKQGESDLYPRPTGMASLRVIILAPLKFSQLKKSAYMNNIYHFRIPFRMNFKSPINIYSLCCTVLYWPRIDFSVTLEFWNIGHIPISNHFWYRVMEAQSAAVAAHFAQGQVCGIPLVKKRKMHVLPLCESCCCCCNC